MQKYHVKLHRRVTDEMEIRIAERDLDFDHAVMHEVIEDAVDYFVNNDNQLDGWEDEEAYPTLKIRHIAQHNGGDYVSEITNL